MKRDLLSRLISRSFGLTDVIQPVLPSHYEPDKGVPSFNSVSFDAEEKRRRSAVPRASAANPAAPAASSSVLIAKKEENVSIRSVSAPSHISRDLTEPTLSLRPPPVRKAAIGGAQKDEDSAGRPSHDEDSTATPIILRTSGPTAVPSRPAPVSPYFPERLKPAGRQDGDDQAGRGIIPADIRVRQSETATPEPGIGAGNFRQPPESVQSPPVTVHIGRIEVRAVVAPGSEPERKRPADSPPRLTLAEYLQRREKGSQ
jgi:hypothetical protein